MSRPPGRVVLGPINGRPGYARTKKIELKTHKLVERWKRVLSPNSRVHWRERSIVHAKDVTDVMWAARAVQTMLPKEPMKHATVDIELIVTTGGRRDADNFLASCKGILDGIVQAGIIKDDDMDTIGTASIRIIVAKERGYSYRITIEEAT
jgi:Holliday junction resolvase RusA-like endonuclease